MRALRALSIVVCLAGAAGPGLAEPMPTEYFVERGVWLAQVEKETFALEAAGPRVARFAAAWAERGSYDVVSLLLGLAPRLKSPELATLLIAKLGEEGNAAIRRRIAGTMGELGLEAFREPLRKACNEDPLTEDNMGGCIVTRGHARVEACAALEALEGKMGDHLDGAAAGSGPDSGWMDGKPE